MTRKKIMLIIPNLSFGGAQRSFSKLSVELAKHFDVINVVFNKDGLADFPLGGELFDLNVASSSWIGGKLFNFWKRVYRLSQLKKRIRFDAAISFLEGADYVNLLSHQNEKLIFSLRGSKRFDQNIRGWLGFIRHTIFIPFVYNKADLIVAVNEGIVEELKKEYKVKAPMQVIYNFYNLEKILLDGRASVEVEFDEIKKTSKIICIVGRLATEKGIDKFMPVFKRVQEEVSVKLLIIGDGVLKQSLKDIAHNLNLITSEKIDQAADVLFIGYQSNPYKYVSKCDALILSSTHEGFPNVLLEAMTLGVPVASTDCPYGPGEILIKDDGEHAGLLLPLLNSSQSENRWTESLIKLLNDDEWRRSLATKGAARAHRFSDSNTIEKWIVTIN